MNRRWLFWGLVIGLVVLASAWLAGSGGAVSSALSRDGSGWLVAHRYLAKRGTPVDLRDRPLNAEIEPGVLVLAFPWQQAIEEGEIEALGGFLRRGGTVLLAYSGEVGRFREERVLEALRLVPAEVRPAPPLAPLPWWRYHGESWNLEPAAGWQGWPVLAVGALRGAPEAPRRARVLYRLESGPALVFEYPLHRGRVIALPAGVLANAWLGEAGNADFLESLRGWLDGGWSFDEYHHGLVAAAAQPESTSRFAWDLFVSHLALIYLLGLAAVARRFGPVWREAPVASGSAASFLRGLGVLHRQMDHHRDAARLLIERARTYSPGLSLEAATLRRADSIAGDLELVELAGEVARAHRRRPPAPLRGDLTEYRKPTSTRGGSSLDVR